MKYSMQKAEGSRQEIQTVSNRHTRPEGERGMTLVETLVAISILAMSIVAPMSLTMQSLSAAYYSRDQVIAANLAQEAIEAVRARRDANILTLALDSSAICGSEAGTPAIHLLCGIPIGQDFIVDARTNPPEITLCSGICPNLKTDNNLYGHDSSWTITTPFRRTVHAEYVGGAQDEIRITVTVDRTSSNRPPPSVVIEENLYRWVADGVSE